MPLPALDGTCEIPTEVCCTTVFDAATALLDRILADLESCIPPGDCFGGLVGYVTIGGFPQDPLCDSLIVTATNIASSSGVAGKLRSIAQHRVSFLIQLHESGFPMIGVAGDDIFVPPPDLVHAVSKHAYAHGERMYRSALEALAGPNPIDGCGFVSIDSFTPIDPSGGCVGWQLRVTVNVNLGPVS